MLMDAEAHTRKVSFAIENVERDVLSGGKDDALQTRRIKLFLYALTELE
jgi:hypothetical protein